MQELQSNEESKGYPNPLFSEDRFRWLYERWAKAVGEETLQELGITQQKMREEGEKICAEFPRGHNTTGALLLDPIVDDTPLEERGVSMKWLYVAWDWMCKACCDRTGPIIPTRLFVVLFVEPLVMQSRSDSCTSAEEVLPLYFFLPLKDRGKPKVFLSHGWDSWLRHLLFLSSTSVPGRMATKRGPENVFLWLDIFAIVQDPGSVKQQSEIARIGQVVRSVGKTCIVIPGHGGPRFALLPARRSWCCLEIAYTQQLSARVGLNKAYFEGSVDSEENIEYHKRLITDICQLKCSDSETTSEEEKKSIQCLLQQELGNLEQADKMIQQSILRAFYERYTFDSRTVDAIATLYVQALDTGGTGSRIWQRHSSRGSNSSNGQERSIHGRSTQCWVS